jgi:hypothetical protein
VPAAEQLREQALEAGVDIFERLAESRAGFPIDLVNRGLQCLERIVQVCKL